MAKLIGLVQVKGGAGRSTVATGLAGELARVHDVVLVDCDMPQATSASWAALRTQAGKAGGLIVETAKDHRELVAAVNRHQDADYVILDGPPRIAEMTRAILLLADLCLIPVGASAAEVWATGDILPIIEEAKKVKPVNVRLLWTRFRSYTRLAQELSEEAEKALGLKAMKTTWGYRVAFAEALGQGQTAMERPDQAARLETATLIVEIKRILR